jgi:hypothetical protein
MASNNLLPPQGSNLRLGDGQASTGERETCTPADGGTQEQQAIGGLGGTLTPKDKIAIIIMPIVVVLLTALLGTGVGIWLQNLSFRRNELFKAKLERIMAGQKEAADILRAVDEARRQIRSNEDFIQKEIARQVDDLKKDEARRYYVDNNPMEPSVAILRESKLRLDAMATYSGSLGPNSPVPNAVQAYSRKLEGFLGCLKENSRFERICSDEHSDLLESVRGIVVAHARMSDELIREYE